MVKFRIFSLLSLVSLFALILASPVAAGPIVGTQCYDTPGVANDVATIRCLEIYAENLVTFILPFAGAIALIFLLVGAIKFVTSSGDPKAVEGAKKTLTYALLGLAAVLGVWFILSVIQTLAGGNIDLTQFRIVW